MFPKKIPLKIFLLTLLLFLSILGIFDLFKPGYFPMHDDTQVARIWEMAQALKDGQFPVRWVGDLGYGYGYPIFNFYNPLVYYLGAILVILGLDVLWATKIIFGLGFILSGLAMFFLAQEIFSSKVAILPAILYLYAPYHAVQLYVRGSLAELWAYAFLPFLLLGIIKKKPVFTGFFLALLILSHNLTAFVSLPLIVVLTFILNLKEKIKNLSFFLFFSLIIGFSLSAFFWLPALAEKKYTQVENMISEKFNPNEHFVFLEQLWSSPWGFAGSAPGLLDGMSFQIGKLHLILIFLNLLFLFFSFKKYPTISFKNLIFFSFWVLSVFLLLPFSDFIWKNFYFYLRYLQFPWRFLVFASLFGSLFCGFLFYFFEKTKTLKFIFWPSLGVLIFLTLFFNLKYFKPQYLYKAQSRDFLGEEKLKWFTSKISDEYLPLGFPVPKNYFEIPKEKFFLEVPAEVETVKKTTIHHQLKIKTQTENFLTFNLAFFPGWQIKMDGKIVKNEDKFLIKLKIPVGIHLIDLEFRNTPVRDFANLISFGSFLYLFFINLLPNTLKLFKFKL